MFTVIDTHKFTDRSGNEKKNVKRILVAKKDTAEMLKRKFLTRRESGSDLRGALFKVFRSNSDKSAAVGNDYEFIKNVKLSSLPDSEIFNFAELLAPDIDEMTKVYAKKMRDEEMESYAASDEGTSSSVEY